jgi:putative AlgH/UPF0301 family transcriptional regulator
MHQELEPVESRALGPGDLLIAPPALNVSDFAGSVIMLVSVAPTMGFVLNHPSGVALSRIAPAITHYMDTEIYWGGPVNSTTVWMLHSNDWRMHNSVAVTDYWSVTSNIQMFDRLSQGEWPERWRVFSGCSVWARDQLTREIDQLTVGRRCQGWLTAREPRPEFVMDVEPSELWQQGTELSKAQAVSSWL